MKLSRFKGVARKPSAGRSIYREGVKVHFPDRDLGMKFVILPAFDPDDPDNLVSYVPAVDDATGEETDWYTTIIQAPFVGHGNVYAARPIISPVTFDVEADDPYQRVWDFCAKSEEWGYLTEKRDDRFDRYRGAPLCAPRKTIVVNIIDLKNPRGGACLLELPEAAARQILYDEEQSKLGFAFQKEFGDITNPDGAQVFSISWPYKKKGCVVTADPKEKVEIPMPFLSQRKNLASSEEIIAPVTGQDVVDQLVSIFRGHESPSGVDETWAIFQALQDGPSYNIATVGAPRSSSIGAWKDAKPKDDAMRALEKLGIVKKPEPQPKKKAKAAKEVKAVSDDPFGMDDYAQPANPEKASSPAQNPALQAIKPGKPEKPEKSDETEVEVMPPGKVASNIPGEALDLSDIAAMRKKLLGM